MLLALDSEIVASCGHGPRLRVYSSFIQGQKRHRDPSPASGDQPERKKLRPISPPDDVKDDLSSMPDDEEQKYYVYVCICEHGHLIKIGSTGNYAVRRVQLNTGRPANESYHYARVYEFSGCRKKDVRQAEDCAHQAMRRRCAPGGSFELVAGQEYYRSRAENRAQWTRDKNDLDLIVESALAWYQPTVVPADQL